ncbi:sigma-70 family RNA polymerase sigma factor [Methylobacterium sp. UNC300MFChir4.1]|uniref:sigma-70 family RNA polymerase sigma factor n=1 Tax=Methylobacterium sp. UNC300MFChir4.1 TaxID=1502747 RepID=UPI0011135E8B|nr:sigma-70 family RNA polymerase sigma factor [Methylobacterium sp. UNC300MFChir4.1]
MDAQASISQEELRAVWTRIVDGAGLPEHDPRTIVAACRGLDHGPDARLRGAMVVHLTQVAQQILRPQVAAHYQNRSRDPVDEVVEAMVEAVLNPNSADGVGFERSFRGKLEKRLIDRIRQEKKRRDVFPLVERDVEEPPVEPLDWNSLGPEDVTVICSILESLPGNHRRAFLLHWKGFGFTANEGESIASMLGVTPKTAKDWVTRAETRILEALGRSR